MTYRTYVAARVSLNGSLQVRYHLLAMFSSEVVSMRILLKTIC